MIVTCVRCHTEFSSDHMHTHVCPTCQFVFSKEGADRGGLTIVSSSELVHQKRRAHRLHEETTARCAFHPDVDAIGQCACCGKPLCYACSVDTGHGCHCEFCAAADMDDASAAPPDPFAAPPDTPPPEIEVSASAGALEKPSEEACIAWERRRHMGTRRALFATWRRTLFSPSRFFLDARASREWLSPLLYSIVWVLAGLAGAVVWKLALRGYPVVRLFFEGEAIDISLQLSPTYGMVAAAAGLSPLIALVFLLATCAIFHLSVVALVRVHGGFRATLRVVCYSTGACVFFFFPPVGGLLAGIWQTIIVAIGLKHAHRISLAAAVATALIPCALLAIGETALTSWSVTGSRLEMGNLLARLLLSLTG